MDHLVPKPFVTNPIARRVLAVALFLGAFAVMGSIFSPAFTRAGDDGASPRRSPATSISTDPHAGLQSLGSLEGSRYVIRMYATEQGARYSVYDQSGAELGVLLTAEQVQHRFDDLPLPTIEFAAPQHLMTADRISDGGM